MAKYRITYEDGVEKKELWFKDGYFEYSMIPNGNCLKSNKPGFDTQYEKMHPELEEDDPILELLKDITNESNDILYILEQIDEMECEDY